MTSRNGVSKPTGTHWGWHNGKRTYIHTQVSPVLSTWHRESPNSHCFFFKWLRVEQTTDWFFLRMKKYKNRESETPRNLLEAIWKFSLSFSNFKIQTVYSAWPKHLGIFISWEKKYIKFLQVTSNENLTEKVRVLFIQTVQAHNYTSILYIYRIRWVLKISKCIRWYLWIVQSPL